MLRVIGGFVTLTIGMLWGLSKHRRAEYRNRVLANFDSQTPDAFGPLPDAVAKMHAQPDLRHQQNFAILPPGRDPIIIDFFLPLHPGSRKFLEACGRSDCCPIAENSTGQYYVELDPFSDDPPVYFRDFDFNAPTLDARSLTEFLSWPRRTR
jgi:hypothetical protein